MEKCKTEYSVIEAGNCILCGKHIDHGNIFLCADCRREEEERECLHGKQKEEATAMERLERLTMAREPRPKLTGREERSRHRRTGGRSE